jgi:hypothetical protein
MKTLIALITQEIRGVITFACPLLLIAAFMPTIFSTPAMIIGLAIGLSLLNIYINYANTKKITDGLLFAPQGNYEEAYHAMIRGCNLDPAHIRLRYSYSRLGIATATLNTISIDPLMWHCAPEDTPAHEAQSILLTHIVPGLTPYEKAFMQDVKQMLTPGAQRFIFKHELGHIVSCYTYQQLVIIGLVTFCATMGAITTTKALATEVNIGIAIIMGMIVGGIMDLGLTFFSNATFKAYHEWKADMFATRWSTPEDIKEAALFWEAHEALLAKHRDPASIMHHVPSVIRTGHMNGKARARLLRNKI